MDRWIDRSVPFLSFPSLYFFSSLHFASLLITSLCYFSLHLASLLFAFEYFFTSLRFSSLHFIDSSDNTMDLPCRLESLALANRSIHYQYQYQYQITLNQAGETRRTDPKQKIWYEFSYSNGIACLSVSRVWGVSNGGTERIERERNEREPDLPLLRSKNWIGSVDAFEHLLLVTVAAVAAVPEHRSAIGVASVPVLVLVWTHHNLFLILRF